MHPRSQHEPSYECAQTRRQRQALGSFEFRSSHTNKNKETSQVRYLQRPALLHAKTEQNMHAVPNSSSDNFEVFSKQNLMPRILFFLHCNYKCSPGSAHDGKSSRWLFFFCSQLVCDCEDVSPLPVMMKILKNRTAWTSRCFCTDRKNLQSKGKVMGKHIFSDKFSQTANAHETKR